MGPKIAVAFATCMVALFGFILLSAADSPDPRIVLELWGTSLRILVRAPLLFLFAVGCRVTGGWRRVDRKTDWSKDPNVDDLDVPIYRPTAIGRWFGLHECEVLETVANEPLLAAFMPQLSRDMLQRARWQRRRMECATWTQLLEEGLLEPEGDPKATREAAKRDSEQIREDDGDDGGDSG